MMKEGPEEEENPEGKYIEKPIGYSFNERNSIIERRRNDVREEEK